MASGFVTKEIESRLKQTPEHIFEVFLEIHQPIHNEAPDILIKYPEDFSDPILKTAANFAYPSRIPPDDQNENFTFVFLDSNGLTFRFGYCRRSNRESTCLCLISYYPWFEVFYNILNDLSQIINSKSETEGERFLASLYNHKLTSMEQFYRNGGKELIEISGLYNYPRPDQRRLPSTQSNLNFTVMFSQLPADVLLRLFAHLLFERRILFISSKLFYLTACACGCLHLINPMHWQSIFLPILPESMAWTTQCTAPYIIGIHSSVYSKLNKHELGDVVIVNIDARTIQSPYDDLGLFPKHLIREMKKDIEQSVQSNDDHLARVFLRTMAFVIGNYASGFVMKNEKFDFDREVYLQQYRGSEFYRLMSAIVNTQIFEQFSRYRTYLQLERELDVDEFDIEVKNVQQSRKPTTSNKIYSIFDKPKTAPMEQRSRKTEERVVNDKRNSLTIKPAETSDSNQLSPILQNDSLIDFDTDDEPILSYPVVDKPVTKEVQSKTQTSANPRDESGEHQKSITQLVEQFDPLHDSASVSPHSKLTTTPINCINGVLQDLNQMSLKQDNLYPSLLE